MMKFGNDRLQKCSCRGNLQIGNGWPFSATLVEPRLGKFGQYDERRYARSDMGSLKRRFQLSNLVLDSGRLAIYLPHECPTCPVMYRDAC